jgi:small GTP-binding protein
VKVVLVGETQVGKSSILERFVNNTFTRDLPSTIGAAFVTKVISTDSGEVRLQLWDTAGQEKFRSLAPMYYRSASVCVLVYDITSQSSLDALDEWAADVADHAPPEIKLIVIGNKLDLQPDRRVPTTAGKAIAQKLQAVYFAETSARTSDGVLDLFAKIADIDAVPGPAAVGLKAAAPQEQEGSGCC